MSVNFKLQQNEEARLDRLFNKLAKKNMRRHIVEDMIQVEKAKKAAQAEARKYKQEHSSVTKRSKLSRKYEESKLKIKADDFIYRMQTRLYSVKSIYLHIKLSVLEAVKFVKDRKKLFFGTALTAAAVLVGVLVYNYAFGCEIILNGKELGVVDNAGVFYSQLDNVDKNLKTWYSRDTLYFEQSLSIRNVFIKDRSKLVSKDECEEKIYGCELQLFCTGGVVLIDGQEAVKLSSVDEAQEAIDEAVNYFLYGSTDGSETIELKEYSMNQQLTAEERIIALGSEESIPDAVAILTNTADDTVKENARATAAEAAGTFETLTSKEYGAHGLKSALAFRSENFSAAADTNAPLLSISTVKEVKYKADIPYTVTYTEDPNAYRGVETELSAGVNGVKEVHSVISYVNGQKVGEEILSETVISEPVAQVIGQGTMSIPAAYSTGTFIMPATGMISAFDKPGSHAGGYAVDIAASTGSPVYASDSGVVSMAGWTSGGYGNCILIDHAGGFQTRYAHLNSISVSVGQTVSQGEYIAGIGSTGYSTGPHLHFEIIYNGSQQYLGYYFQNMYDGAYVNAFQ